MNIDKNIKDGVLTITRLYDAPREAVFDAWIETSKLSQWWGCGDTERVTSTVEAKVGGAYNHLMTIKNVGDHDQRGVITAFDPPARLAYELAATDFSPTMQVTVDFTEEDGGTRVTLVQSALPAPLEDVVAAGWTAGFEKLAAFLA